MIIIPSNVASAPSDPNWSNTTLMLKTIATPGATNNAFFDDGPNKFVPTRNGDVTQGALSPYIPSGYWSAYFDGTGDSLSLPASSAFTFATGDFTVECFYQITGSGSDSVYYLCQFDGLRIQNYFGTLYLSGASVNYMNAATGVGTASGRWYHLAVCRSGSTTTMYVDGVSVATSGSVPNLTDTNLRIGDGSSGGAAWRGNISNFRVVKGSAVYTSAFTPPTSPLTAITNTSLLALQDNRLIDRSTNNLTLTRNGDVSVSRFAPFGVQVPVTTNLASTGSVAFDGSGDYLTVPNNAALQMGTSSFTLEFWFNPTTFSGTFATPFEKGYASTGGLLLQCDGTDKLVVYFSGVAIITSTVAITNGRWHHIALVRNGSAVTLYINGASAGTATNAADLSHAGTLSIGARQSDGAYSVNGNISGFRVVKGTAVYTAAFTPPTSPLTAITGTSLLTCQDAVTVTDASTNNFTVTRVGNAAASEVSPFKRATAQYGGSGYFDGAGDYLTLPNNTALQFGTGDFCVEGWFWREDANNGRTLFSIGDFGGGLMFRTDYFSFVNSSVFSPNASLPVGQWFHAAVTRASGTLRVFVNGTAISTTSNSSNHGSASSTVGTSAHAPTSEVWKGWIANCRVVKGTAVYTAAFTPPTAPVTAISGTSLLLNFDNAGIYDASGINMLNTSGAAQTSSTIKKYDSTSLAVNDTSATYANVPGTSNTMVTGTGDFTIEFFVYRNNTNNAVLYDQRPTGSQGAQPVLACVGATLYYQTNAAYQITGPTLAANTWYHVAVCRSSGSTRLFVNGTQSGITYSDSNNYQCPANRPMIGNDGFQNGTGDFRLNGHIENLRITRAARYTANFTAPTTAFPTQ